MVLGTTSADPSGGEGEALGVVRRELARVHR
jgi:hypothetical protein